MECPGWQRRAARGVQQARGRQEQATGSVVWLVRPASTSPCRSPPTTARTPASFAPQASSQPARAYPLPAPTAPSAPTQQATARARASDARQASKASCRAGQMLPWRAKIAPAASTRLSPAAPRVRHVRPASTRITEQLPARCATLGNFPSPGLQGAATAVRDRMPTRVDAAAAWRALPVRSSLAPLAVPVLDS